MRKRRASPLGRSSRMQGQTALGGGDRDTAWDRSMTRPFRRLLERVSFALRRGGRASVDVLPTALVFFVRRPGAFESRGSCRAGEMTRTHQGAGRGWVEDVNRERRGRWRSCPPARMLRQSTRGTDLPLRCRQRILTGRDYLAGSRHETSSLRGDLGFLRSVRFKLPPSGCQVPSVGWEVALPVQTNRKIVTADTT